jgi:DNA-binding GntR family transcriptional regulator
VSIAPLSGSPENKNSSFELRSLREQVYQYLRAEMQNGRITPGKYLRLNRMSEQLGISKTPLRDAIIRLECEGFVTILPRRGVLMNRMTLQDVKDAYEIVGALEACRSWPLQPVHCRAARSHGGRQCPHEGADRAG